MEITRKKIFAISGSTRKNSTNEAILMQIAQLFKQQLDIEIFDGLAELPHFNPDIQGEEIPKSVLEFREKIAQADGVIICTPEYVFSLPGALKNAIEWTVATTVFSQKPTTLITASTAGEKAHESLILVMKTIGARIADEATLLISNPRSKVSPTGEITHPDTLFAIENAIHFLINSIHHPLN
jgi:chromate reductase, NAD(P)H dehydrogenase (quinone)